MPAEPSAATMMCPDTPAAAMNIIEFLLRDYGEILHMLAIAEQEPTGEDAWMTPAYVVGMVRVTHPVAAGVLMVLLLADSVHGRSPLWDVVAAYRRETRTLGDAALDLYQRYLTVRELIDTPSPVTRTL